MSCFNPRTLHSSVVDPPHICVWFACCFTTDINPIQTGLFSTFWDGGGGGLQKPPLCNFKTAYAMATKFAQDSVRANTNHHIYCDVTVT